MKLLLLPLASAWYGSRSVMTTSNRYRIFHGGQEVPNFATAKIHISYVI